MPKMTILCGISGSGKSTFAKEIEDSVYCSADNYFLTKGGEYDFHPAELPLAHGACLRHAVMALTLSNEQDIVVDNTNTTVAEIAPYAALALAYGYELDIVKIQCDVDTAIERNVHGVPPDVIRAQAWRLDSLELPPYWPVRVA